MLVAEFMKLPGPRTGYKARLVSGGPLGQDYSCVPAQCSHDGGIVLSICNEVF